MTQTHSIANDRIAYGRHVIDFTIVRRPRTTLEIAVEPDLRVVIAAPLNASIEDIREKVKKRAAWVHRQQHFFSQYMPRTPERKFISGETHLYLGRQYRLKVRPDIQEYVQHTRGFIFVHSRAPKRPERTRQLLQTWYKERAHATFHERLRICRDLFPNPPRFSPKELIVRDLRRSWGSMSPSSRLILNRRLIEAPMDAIDYVITHELCHIEIPRHTPSFYNLLTQIMPDWQTRKSRLEKILS